MMDCISFIGDGSSFLFFPPSAARHLAQSPEKKITLILKLPMKQGAPIRCQLKSLAFLRFLLGTDRGGPFSGLPLFLLFQVQKTDPSLQQVVPLPQKSERFETPPFAFPLWHKLQGTGSISSLCPSEERGRCKFLREDIL